jgi:tRNA uridine 5-carboxymethylaminomethyl modification enzyme
MFTSRCEYRLLLREDNADLRLREIGYRVGLVGEDEYRVFEKKKKAIEEEMDRIEKVILRPSPSINDRLREIGTSPIMKPTSLKELLKRPEISYREIALFDPESLKMPREVMEEVEIMAKYDGYLQRQEEEIRAFRFMEDQLIPEEIDYLSIPGLSTEVREKLTHIRPISLGQASRISGITPAAISILMVYLKRWKGNPSASKG